MKIAVRGGHTELCTGTRGIIDELTEDRKVKNAVVSKLKALGHNVLDVTPPVNYTSDVGIDLAYGVNKANSWGAELFVSIHFNNAYNSYNGAIGTEVEVYSPFDKAQSVVNSLASVGFINRGQKTRTGLYELKHTNCKSMIIEVCFVEATKDVETYREVGIDGIANAIVKGLTGQTVKNVTDKVEEKPNYNSLITYQSHLQNIGWQGAKHGGEVSGTVGEARRLEALTVKWEGKGTLHFQGHVQSLGWSSIRNSGEVVGTVGESLRLEAVKIWLDGSDRKLKYRVHIQNKGWTNWVSEKEIAGTAGQRLRIEAIEIQVE